MTTQYPQAEVPQWHPEASPLAPAPKPTSRPSKMTALYAGAAALLAAGLTFVGMTLAGGGSGSTPTITPGPQALAHQFVGEQSGDGTTVTSAIPVAGTEIKSPGNITELVSMTFSDGTRYLVSIDVHNGEKLFHGWYQQN